ncbi:MAG: hypothetical protein IT516_08430 [Burkholderiales bacterium]|nr:hypothetical protein [Burkholderiales bacterium]
MQHREVFIVRVWTGDAASRGFRAAVQRAGTDESAWFTDSAALARYLETCGGDTAEDADGAGGGAPP